MQKKTPSPAYLLRRIQVYKKRYESAVELRRQQATQIEKYRDQLSGVLEGQVRTARMATEELTRARDTLASNAMTIRELNDQVAVQYKLAAEARSDVERASKLAMEAAAKHNRMVQLLHDARKAEDQAFCASESLRTQLCDAQRTLQYRIWYGTRTWILGTEAKVKAWVLGRRQFLTDRWVVKRLTHARVMALNEAGFIPKDLVRMAYTYWNNDKLRARELKSSYDYTDVQPWTRFTRPPSIFRRLKIWLGRA